MKKEQEKEELSFVLDAQEIAVVERQIAWHNYVAKANQEDQYPDHKVRCADHVDNQPPQAVIQPIDYRPHQLDLIVDTVHCQEPIQVLQRWPWRWHGHLGFGVSGCLRSDSCQNLKLKPSLSSNCSRRSYSLRSSDRCCLRRASNLRTSCKLRTDLVDLPVFADLAAFHAGLLSSSFQTSGPFWEKLWSDEVRRRRKWAIKKVIFLPRRNCWHLLKVGTRNDVNGQSSARSRVHACVRRERLHLRSGSFGRDLSGNSPAVKPARACLRTFVDRRSIKALHKRNDFLSTNRLPLSMV